MHRDLVEYAFKNILRRRLRSWLTIIGIVVGITAVILIISLGIGLDKEIRAQLNKFGSNYIVVIPGKGLQDLTAGMPQFSGALYQEDVDAVKIIDGVDDATGILAISAFISFKGEKVSQFIHGVDWSVYGKWTETTAGYESGGPLQEGDVGGVVIGHNIAYNLFEREVRVGNTVTVQGRDFKVRGIFKEVGGIGGDDFDGAVYIDIKAARELQGPTYEKNRVQSIFILTQEGADLAKVAEKVDSKLLDRHRVSEEDKDFTIMTADTLLEQIGGITALLSLFLAGIASISLLVGGIGIANAMFTSVVERTQEIGILKSVGASTHSVLELFLIESALIGLVGGIVGVVFGMVMVFVLQQFGVPIVFSLELLAFALAFATIVGGVSGYFPARQAAQLQPLEALRRD